MIENAEHGLEFLPSYSPDLNPIEPKWAQAMAIRRRTGQTPDEIFGKTFRTKLGLFGYTIIAASSGACLAHACRGIQISGLT
ncbi:hypothetical protein PAE61_14945 [Paracoccus aerodenitrificans]|nr:transposase [Paracoccus aerodenitrificans]WBU65751.1 hypothetical protein PAE61_14945 [Paracoccus aerodenitrificans]